MIELVYLGRDFWYPHSMASMIGYFNPKDFTQVYPSQVDMLLAEGVNVLIRTPNEKELEIFKTIHQAKIDKLKEQFSKWGE